MDLVNLVHVEQVVVVGEDLRRWNSIVLFGLLCPLRDQIAEGDELALVRKLCQGREMLPVGNTAAAYNSDLNFTVFHFETLLL